MNAEEFVRAIRSEVQVSAVHQVMRLLARPPGRRPAASHAALSQWFHALSPENQQRVRDVATMASERATFGFLTVLDGVRVVEDGGARGEFELRYVRGGESTLLNDPNGPMLHDLLADE